MKFRTLLTFGIFATFCCSGAEQDVLITTDFVLKAGASQSRTLNIAKPEQLDTLVMIGFNPIKALSVDCVLRLYSPSEVFIGSYNCGERQSHVFKQPLLVTSKVRVQIEVTNYNFTTTTTAFSVTNRFKFVAPAN